MQLLKFNYNLPQELIAQKPLRPRHNSRLLVLDKKTGIIKHDYFFNLKNFLWPGDVLVFNNSKVIPARLGGRKKTGGRVEVLLTRETKPGLWRAMLKKIKEKDLGVEIIFEKGLKAQTEKFLGNGLWEIKFNLEGQALKDKIKQLGQTPTPPYIRQKAALQKYQTIYAQKEGSVAAPTAGFHFSEKIFQDLKKMGVQTEFITLHVGPGTFLPVKTENIRDHQMHSEWASVDKKTAQRLNQYKKNGRRIVAVGTTTARVLEAFSGKNKKIKTGAKEVDIFIYPGYRFQFIDALITNFHLPQSTLLMLVCALAGRKNIFKAYQEAIKKKYRFYSFGDAMLIK